MVLDANKRFVARTIEPERYVGQLASESLRGALERAAEGWFRGTTLEGWEVYTPYNRSDFSGWTVAIGIPAAAVDASFRRSFFFVTSFGLIVLGLGIAPALVLSKRTASSIESLSRMAEDLALGKRNSPETLSTRIAEVERVSEALVTASCLIRDRSEERDRMERILRTESAVNRVLAESLTFRDASPKILQIICELGGWDVGAIWEIDQMTNEPVCSEFWHLPSIEVPDFGILTNTTNLRRALLYWAEAGAVAKQSGLPIWPENRASFGFRLRLIRD